MTTFGGSTIPPIFGGASAFPTSGPIFVRSVGAFYNSVVDGVGEQDLPQPGITLDDDLFVLLNGNASTGSPVNAGDWTNLFSVSFNRFELFHRKATLTANDEFTIAAHTSLQVGVMASLSNTDDITDTISQFQGGSINSDADDTWNVNAIANNVTEDPLAAIMLFCGRNTTTVVASPSVINAAPLATTIAQIGVSQVGEGSVWLYWGFDYENPSIAYGAFVQGYAPTQGAVQWTQYQRYRLVP